MTFTQTVNSTGGPTASAPMLPLHMLINPTYMWHQADHPVIREVPALGFVAVLGNSVVTHFQHATSEVHHLFLDVTLSGGAVTSWHHTCTSPMTFCYKRSANTSFEALWLLVHPSGSPLSSAYGWCLMCVGCDVSSASPGWSLLPSRVFIVLA